MLRLIPLLAWCVAAPLWAEEPLSFNRDIRPILAENCFACHGFDPKHREAGLRLDTFDGATEDRDGSRGIVPGDVSASEVWQRIISHDPDTVMPPPAAKKELTEPERQLIKTWIEQGAKYERHWSFEPPRRSDEVTGHPIDYFIGKKLSEHHLLPSPPADDTTLIRRVCLDLVGLPPDPLEVDAFVQAAQQDRPAAYRELVERLLASPHYGERWGRWWLDQARYADSNGYSIDAPRQIWKFRDWVVEALNTDMPFDQFTIEQLAGDLLPDARESQIIATGFHRNTQINQEGGIDKEQFRIDSVFDRVATTGTVWLGLSIGCAQCHDHKFDPIEQVEYYRMFAFLNSQDEPTLKVADPGVDVDKLKGQLTQVETQLKSTIAERYSEITTWIAAMSDEFRKGLAADVKKAVEKPADKRSLADNIAMFTVLVNPSDPIRIMADKHKDLENQLSQGTTTLVMKELPEPRKTAVLIKGDFTRPADEVTPGTPSVLHPLESTSARLNRLDLARWIVSPKNPLTARVIVNRVWQQYFGRGIVETENDFGTQGTSPTHPELLDWLALELVEKKWSLKELHRLIVTSQTYQQSSKTRADLKDIDPNNYLLARQTRLRLDAEIVRDLGLKASGLLCAKLGGPPVYPPIPDGVMGQGQVKRDWAVSPGEDKYRRGLYTFVYRASPPPSLIVFDAPDGYSSCTRRIRSNTPLQALTILNDAAFHEFAMAMEKIIISEGLESAFMRCTSRRPTADELVVFSKLDTLSAARVMLNLDESLTRE